MKKVLIFLLFLFCINLYGQKEANIWYFGANTGLNFNTSPPTTLADGKMYTLEGCTSFSDKNGNLLFYVGALNLNDPNNTNKNRLTVWTKDHRIMRYTNNQRAIDLKGNTSSSQSALAIPKPKSNSIYYIFTVDKKRDSRFDPPAEGFNLYTIDMSLDGGRGQLIDEDNDGNFFKNLSDGNEKKWTEKVAAVKGTECDTFWVVSVTDDTFYSYKITKDGVNLTPVVSKVDNSIKFRGYLKISPDGKKLAVANKFNTSSYEHSLLLYSFNATTGKIANDGISLLDKVGENFNEGDGRAYGVEFSRNSQKLYVSTTEKYVEELDKLSTYKLFQFDLNTPDIRASKVKIHQQKGFRGALQLGPDGKIYATIPQTYSNEDGFAEFLGAIENPNAPAANIIFTQNAINLNGKKGTQGLPPFISSLFLPIDITDPDTGTSVNNQFLSFCDGKTLNFNSEIIAGANNLLFEWTFNNGTTTSVISNNPNITLTNIKPEDTGQYKLIVSLEDACGVSTLLEGVFNLTVYQTPVATQPSNTTFCDTDNDGFNSFDLQATKNTAILNGQDPAIFDVVYYLSQADADANTNALSNPYTNSTAFSSQTIYARVHNKANPEICYATTFFTLTITGLPSPQTPTDYNVCDDTSVGSETDGFINHFLLNTRDSQILGTLNPNEYSVSYHTTLLGAQTDNSTNVIDKTSNYTNTTDYAQTVFVRVENNNNTSCFDASKTLKLVVNPSPVVVTNATLRQCDDDNNGFTEFNLNEVAEKISANYTNETFTFYPTLLDAQNNTNSIINSTNFINRVITTDKIWARITTTFGCYKISEVTLTVSQTQIPTGFMRNFNSCDDYVDAINHNQDGISSFNFSSVTAAVLNVLGNPNNVTISYFRNETDALTENNPITNPSNYRNIGYPNTQNIYVRVDSDNSNDCIGLGHHITLTVDRSPFANSVNNLLLCDDHTDGDNTNGIVQTFNLSSQTTAILGNQNPANFNVTYHLSAADAISGANAIATPTAFTNTTRDLQTIYIRIVDLTNGCVTNHTSFNLLVNPLPIANFVNNIEICDENSDGSAHNGFSQSINLDQQTAIVLGNQDPNQFSVSYHVSLANAQNNIFPLVTTNYSNTTPFREIIYVRVSNTHTNCANNISSFDVIINPEPLANPDNTVSNLSLCDDDNRGLGNDTDGIIENINLNSQIPTILGATQNPNDYTVTFHHNQTDVVSGTNAIISPYTNTNPTETIYVRIQNNATSCVNDELTFELIINPLPDFQIISPQIACLNNLPKVLSIENPNDVYDYVWKDKNGFIISTQTTVNISTGGLYTVTATTSTGTNCSKTKRILVNESSSAILTENDITIIDNSENNSITINNTNNQLGIGEYEYALTDLEGNFIRIYQNELVFENLKGNIYNILVRDRNGCGITELVIPVVQFPKFFTPNNDGVNDLFQMKGVNKTFFPISEMYIYDRFGKIVAKIPIDSKGWNGTYNGKTLISDDYWYTIRLVDRYGVKREQKGNFSLLRK